jgi:Uma2 family endonuclease
MTATTARAPRLSLKEYFALPTDDERTELVFGECVVSPRPSEEHSDLVHDLAEILKRWVRHHQLGKVSIDIDVVFDEPKQLVYAPDILFTRKANRARRVKGRLYGVPDLCIEVLSPSERPWLQNRKFADYEEYGVRWYWTIALAEEPRIEEYELVDGSYICRQETGGMDWFSPGAFPNLHVRLSTLLTGDLKNAVKGKAKRLM